MDATLLWASAYYIFLFAIHLYERHWAPIIVPSSKGCLQMHDSRMLFLECPLSKEQAYLITSTAPLMESPTVREVQIHLT